MSHAVTDEWSRTYTEAGLDHSVFPMNWDLDLENLLPVSTTFGPDGFGYNMPNILDH